MAAVRVLALSLIVSALSAAAQPPEAPADAERGKYLVHRVAMCVQCHSPRDASGELVATKLLTGAPMPIASPFPNKSFATVAPRIAGLPGYSEKEAVRLLVEGRNRDGAAPRPPMPAYRMTPEDARAIVSFLKSLDRAP